MIDIFDFSIVRIAARSLNELFTIEQKSLSNLCADINLLKKNKIAQIEQVCEQLYLEIKQSNNTDNQKKLLNLKRDIYNERYKIENLQKKIHLLSTSIADSITDLMVLEDTLNTKYCELALLYSSAANKEKTIIQNFCKTDSFSKGLLLSSKEIYNIAQKAKIGAILKNDEYLGLWKYITRTVAKTSPFSTFTCLAEGTLINTDQKENIAFRQSKKANTNFVRYNNYCLSQILIIIKANPRLRNNISIILNSTILVDGEVYKFFTNIHNTEAIQKIQITPVIDLVQTFLSNNSSVTYSQLIYFLEKKVDASYNELDIYIFELIKTGFIEFSINFSGLDQDWDISLANYLKSTFSDDLFIKTIIVKIETLIDLRKRYAIADNEECMMLLEAMNSTMSDILYSLHKDAKLPEEEREITLNSKHFTNDSLINDNIYIQFTKSDENSRIDRALHLANTRLSFGKKNTIYEDVRNHVNVNIKRETITEIISELTRFMNNVDPICFPDFKKQAYKNYFKNKFVSQKNVSMLEFYENLYKDVYNNYKESKENSEESIKNARTNINNVQQLDDSIINSIKSNEEINIQTNQIQLTDQIVNSFCKLYNISKPMQNKKRSYSAYVQLYDEIDSSGNNKLHAVINAVITGYGKSFSRFLSMFDKKITEKLLQWNKKCTNGNDILVENNDSSVFNANLHNCLTEKEIYLPGGQRRSDSSNSLHISELYLTLENENLFLRNSEGKNIVILDLCFQGLAGRSKLFQILNAFGQNFYFASNHLLDPFSSINSLDISKYINSDERTAIYIPRIILGQNNIVLRRKRWYITKAAQPKFNDHSAHIIYCHLNEWRKSLHMPDEVFITLLRQNKDFNNDDHKPQYINFNSPMCILTFQKLMRRQNNIMQIEEMLPNSKQLYKYDNNPFVTEFVLQWQ